MVRIDGGSGDSGGGTDDPDTTSTDLSGLFGDPAGDGGDTSTTDDGGIATSVTEDVEEQQAQQDDGGGISTSVTEDIEQLDDSTDADTSQQPATGPGANGDVMDQVPEQGIEESGATEQVETAAQDFEEQILQENPGLTSEDISVSLVGGQQGTQLVAEFTQGAQNRRRERLFDARRDVITSAQDDPGVREAVEGLGGADLLEPTRTGQREARSEIRDLLEESIGSARASAAGVTDPLLRSEVIEETELQEGQEFRISETDGLLQAELTEQFEEEFEAEQREDVRGRLSATLSSQLGVSLDPESDIQFEEDGGEISATLSERGERRVQVERAPIVGAAETVGVFESETREVAGAAAEFRAFGEEQREQFVEPSLQSLRESTGLESEIEAFESLQDQATAAEEEFLRPARETVSDQVPAGLAAGAVAVGTRGASLTPPGRVAVGAALATGAAADVFEDLPPEQQLEIATAVGTASAPVSRAQQTLTGPEVDSPAVRAEIPSALPGEFDAPEQPEPIFDPELPATPGPFFVSELDVPLGRPTLQEIPVGEGVLPQPLTLERPDDPTEGAAGRAEVPIDIEDGEVSVGPAEAGEAIQRERPEPAVPADPMGETVTGRELEEATGRLERQRQIEERLGRRQQGAEVGEGVVLQRLREDALAEQLDRLDAATAAEVLSEPAPAPMPAAAAPVADVTATQATDTAVQQDFRMDFDLDTRVDTRFDLPTVQTTEFARPGEVAQPTIEAPAFETVFGTGVATPRVPTGEFPLPGLSLDSDDPRRRERDIDEFEREFTEPVISPEEALEADRGGPEAMDFSDDMT